jgi:hypothetical protein
MTTNFTTLGLASAPVGVTIRVDDQAVQKLLGDAVKEIPFTLALALNRTGEDINAARRDLYPTQFHARNQQLIRWLAPPYLGRDKKATKTNLTVLLDTGLSARFLDPFETGRPHQIDRLGRLVAVPSSGFGGLRPMPMTVIQKQLYPVNLGLQLRRDPKGGNAYYALGRGSIKKRLTPLHVTAAGKHQWQGRFGTFQVDTPKGPMIFQRTGPGYRNTRLLWSLKPSVPRPANLRFVEVGKTVAAAKWLSNLNNSALWVLLHPHA